MNMGTKISTIATPKNYEFLIAIFLLLLMVMPLRQYEYFTRLIVSIALVWVISKWMTHDDRKALFITAIASVVIFVTLRDRYIFSEFFENSKDIPTNKAITPDEVSKILDADQEEKQPTGTNTSLEDSTDINFAGSDTSLLMGVGKKKDKQVSEMTPAEAQRETFKMVDTLKQLKETMDNMAPTLKSGKRLMEAFEKLNLKT